jgi:hypothetical protein
MRFFKNAKTLRHPFKAIRPKKHGRLTVFPFPHIQFSNPNTAPKRPNYQAAQETCAPIKRKLRRNKLQIHALNSKKMPQSQKNSAAPPQVQTQAKAMKTIALEPPGLTRVRIQHQQMFP